jgi:hypothetical protein
MHNVSWRKPVLRVGKLSRADRRRHAETTAQHTLAKMIVLARLGMEDQGPLQDDICGVILPLEKSCGPTLQRVIRNGRSVAESQKVDVHRRTNS